MSGDEVGALLRREGSDSRQQRRTGLRTLLNIGAGESGTVDASLPNESRVALKTEAVSLGCAIVDAYVDDEHVAAYLSLTGANPDAERLGLGLFHAKIKIICPQ